MLAVPAAIAGSGGRDLVLNLCGAKRSTTRRAPSPGSERSREECGRDLVRNFCGVQYDAPRVTPVPAPAETVESTSTAGARDRAWTPPASDFSGARAAGGNDKDLVLAFCGGVQPMPNPGFTEDPPELGGALSLSAPSDEPSWNYDAFFASGAARTVACASAAGTLATLLTHPLDTWAVAMQTGRTLPANPAAYLRGIGPAAVQGAAVYGCMLGGFEALLASGLSLTAAAALAAFPEAAFRGPLEAIKNLKQTGQAMPKGAKALGALLATGTAGTLAREVPGNIAYFTTQDAARSAGCGPWVAGLLMGATYTASVYPLESVRAQVVCGAALVDARPTMKGCGPFAARACLLTGFVTFFYDRLLAIAPVYEPAPST